MVVVRELKLVLDLQKQGKMRILLGSQNLRSLKDTICMQHLPLVHSLFCLLFLQPHHTSIPAAASAATDPNTAPTMIQMVTTKREKLEMKTQARKKT